MFNAKDDNGYTPLIWAVSVSGNNNLEVLNTLINAGADVNAREEHGWTILMCAAGNNNKPEVFNVLIKAGADIFIKDKYGKTVLDYAKNDEVKRIILNATK